MKILVTAYDDARRQTHEVSRSVRHMSAVARAIEQALDDVTGFGAKDWLSIEIRIEREPEPAS
jgi:hypothetical protein